MKEHSVKIQRPYFEAVVSGAKRYEIRRDDRGYAVGDALLLREIDDAGETTGRTAQRTISYISRPNDLGLLPEGVCVLSLAEPPDTLRAEHQRLTDAVVAAALKLKLWADNPNHSEAGTTLRFELYQECTALAAFEAQHPEVRG